ncbi:hypothetical protein JCM8097_006885 [Rhodosporidiobolus ruineniae]
MADTDTTRGRSRVVSPAGRPASPHSPASGATSPTHLQMPFRQQHHHLSPLAVQTRFSSSGSSSGASSSSATPPQVAVAKTHRTLSSNLPTPLAAPSSSSHPHHPPHPATPPPIVTGSTLSTPSAAAPATTQSYAQSLASPCFIHSHLDNTLSDYAKRSARSLSPRRRRARKSSAEATVRGDDSELGRRLQRTKSEGANTITSPSSSSKYDEAGVQAVVGSPTSSVDAPPSLMSSNAVDDEEYDEDEDDEEANSWTRQLAETAVSVREMSKQLGRARVVSHIQSVMIVTKARDNQLTRLTRELALWLMKTPRNGKDRGLVVYVDSQLRTSKRFDAAGLEREHPELFRPLPSRRYSRTSSSASLATDGGPLRKHGAATPHHHHHGTITPLSMTNLNEALLKRNNSISSGMGGAAHAKRAVGEEGDEGQLRYWTNEMCRKSPHLFDFVITLGGDGTVLYTSWLFQQIVPPVIPFALGSLGFLTNFDYSTFPKTLDAAIDSGVRVNLRMRFTCTVYRAVTDGDESCKRLAVKSGRTGGIFMKSLTREGWDAIESGKPLNEDGTAAGAGKERKKDKSIKCFSTRAVESFEVLNDLVVDRGPSPYVSQLELFGDEHHMTTVQADGLTVSTPTGSTAYSLSAGGSLVHPEIPAILITPICPHTLSFRPMLLPDSMELRICVPYNSRSTAWASFDGRGRVELRQGDHIKVTASPYPFPTVCADKQSTDWFHSIARTLKWNERQRQKSFVMVEEGRKKPRANHDQPKKESAPAAPASVSSSATAKKPTVNGSSEKHAAFADPVYNGEPGSGGIQDDDEEEDDDELDEEDEEGEATATSDEEYDIDDISDDVGTTTTNGSSPAIPPTDPSAPVPPLSTVSPQRHAAGSSSAASAARAPEKQKEANPGGLVSSASSSVSVDIQDDPKERFVTEPPRGRGRSRSRGGAKDGKGGKGGAGEGDDGEKSEDRAFVLLGADSGSSDEDDERSERE